MSKTTFLINALSNPIMVGVYEEDKLSLAKKSNEKCSKILVPLLDELLKDFTPDELIYANGPGSFMGIKLSYTILQTFSLVKNIPLFAISAFLLNDYKPIKAKNDLCFVYNDGKISLANTSPGEFFLPKSLKNLKLLEDNLPFYFLPAL